MEHGHDRRFLTLSFCISFIPFLFSSYASPFSNPPLLGIHPLDEKYFQPEVIKCKDGSKSFTRDRVNDDFCDCLDGTDEPGTSACPAGKFYCRNVGSIPRFIFSSRVNDRFCGLKVIIILQAVLIGSVVVFRIFHRRARSKKRRLR
ncbi:hypothetical protein F2P56_002038 [Juglans regia]|uniref:Glucosidase II beta subunit N-terminal domain-containing protein n=1 Tax=Juglans regia TaxID=51240 RepID=A0A833Y0D6_JUGRE|nr:hypothetical protein F2P56_002038 [Juglans regia]